MKSFTLEEAEEIAEDFADLTDTDFRQETNYYIIDSIVPCPFDENERQEFVRNYLQTKDVHQALSFYKGNDYDVLLFAYSENDNPSYICIDIRAFAQRQGINYRFP